MKNKQRLEFAFLLRGSRVLSV